MAFATWFPTVRYHREHCNEGTWMCYHQALPLTRVVAHVGDAGQAKPHLEHNPLSLLGTCHATPIRKLNDPDCDALSWLYTGVMCRCYLMSQRAVLDSYTEVSTLCLCILARVTVG